MKATKGKKLLNYKRFSRNQLLIFVLAFGVIGYFVWHSFAASAPNPPTLNSVSTTSTIGSTVSKYAVLNWAVPSSASPITSYKIYRGPSSGAEDMANPVAKVGPFTSWTDTTTSSSATYFYKVSAISTDSVTGQQLESSPSNEMSATTGSSATNAVALDDITCGTNLQLGSDRTASKSATPSIWLHGDGGLSSYTIKIDGVQILNPSGGTIFSSDGFSNVCIQVSVPLADGYHQLTGTEVCPHGPGPGTPCPVPYNGPTYTVAPFDFSVDTVIPPTPSTPLMASFSDSGVSGDNVTRFHNPTFCGVESEPNTAIQLFDGVTLLGGAKSGTSNCPAPSNWSSSVTSLPDGNYNVYALSLDQAGNKSTNSATVPLRIESIAPTISITSPTTSTVPAGLVNISADASDNSGGVGIWKVDFLIDGQCVKANNICASTDTDAPYSYNWDTSALASGSSHTLSVVAYDKAGNTTTSPISTVTIGQVSTSAPGAPVLNTATPGNNSVSLSWSAPGTDGGSAITSYKVYRGTTSGSEALLTTLGNVTSYVDNTATNGTTYYYQVTAQNSLGEGPRSSEKNATPVAPSTPPSAPSLNTATTGNGQVTLAWTAPTNSGGTAITGYKVYRGTASNSETFLTSVGNVTSFIDTGLANGTTYYYKVSAINSVGEGSQSTEKSAVPASVPNAPDTFVASEPLTTGIWLNWHVPANGGSTITSYKIYRSTSSGTETFFDSSGSNSYIDTKGSVTAGTTYYYKITAVNAVGESAFSAEASFKFIERPGQPVLNTLTATNNSTSLAWSPPANDGGSAVTNYNIYRGTSSGTEGFLTTVGNVTSYVDSSVFGNSSYYYQITAVNAVGESTPKSNEKSVFVDGTRPLISITAPVDGTVNLSGAVNINASATDNTAIARVELYINGVLKDTKNPTPATNYAYTYSWNTASYTNGPYSLRVVATDLAGNVSALVIPPSAPPNQIAVSVCNGDCTAPNPPASIQVTAKDYNFVSLSWPAASDNTGGSGVKGYILIRNGSSINDLQSLITATSYTDTSVSPSTPYTYSVTACDFANNCNATSLSPTVSDTTPAQPIPDTTAPDVPSGVAATAVSSSQINVTWNVSNDTGGSGLKEYDVYRDGTQVAIVNAPATSWGDTGLATGSSHNYTVKAKDNAGNTSAASTPTPASSATTFNVPSAPTLTSATPGNNSVTLSWTTPTSDGGAPIGGYHIFRGTSSGNETLIGTTPLINTITDSSAQNGTTYYYQIAAASTVGEGPKSNEKTATPATVPVAPVLNSATASPGSVSLSWSPPSSNGGSAITGYKIYRATTSGSESLLTTLGNQTSFNDTNLTNGTTYFYQVTAVNGVGESTKSTEKSATPATTPSAPTLNTVNPSGSSLVLSWVAPSNTGGSAVTGYKIYRGTSSNGETLLTTQNSLATSFTDTNVTANTTYYYKVSAVNSVGEGSQSSEKSGLVDTQAPTNVTVSAPNPASGTVTVTATASDNVGIALVKFFVDGTEVSPAGNSLLTYSWNTTSAANGSHFLKVTASDAAGNSTTSSTVTVTVCNGDCTPPSVPGTLSAPSPAFNQVNLSWGAASDNVGVAGYYIVRNGSTIAQTVGTGTVYTDNTVSASTDYIYVVFAYDAAGNNGPNSNAVSFKTPAAPTAPGSFSLISADSSPSGTQVTVSWNPSSGATSYDVYRNSSLISNVPSSCGCSYGDTGLATGTTYTYSVVGKNSVGNTTSTPSSKSVTTFNVPGLPNLFGAVAGDRSVGVSWTAPTNNGGTPITGYKVYRGTASNSETFLTSVGNVTSFIDTGLANGTTYYYKVSAINSVGEGSQSTEKSAVPANTPAAPVLNSASVGSSSINLGWSPPSNNGGSAITAYRIYRGTSAGSESLYSTLGNVTNYSDTAVNIGVTYYYKVSAVNSIGEGSLSNEQSGVLTDKTQPTINISSPQNGSSVSGNVNLGALASDNVGIARVEFWIDDNLLTTVGSAPYQTSWNSASVQNGSHTIMAKAVDTSGNQSSASVTVTTNNGDTTPPAVSISSPTDGATVAQSVNVAAAASDNIGLAKVEFYIDGGLVSTANSAPYTYTWDSTTVNNSTHAIAAKAYDAANNASTAQITVTVANGDTTPPSAPGNLTASVPNSTTVNLTWDSSDDNVGVAGYHLYRQVNGTAFTYIADSLINSYTDSTVIAGNTYNYYIVAFDAQQNNSNPSNTASVFVPLPPPDTTPPSAPIGLLTGVVSANQINLSWNPSTDNVRVARYDIYRSNTKIATVDGSFTSYGDTSVLPRTSYTYWLYAFDASNNKSAISNKSSVTTPTIVSGLGSLTGHITNNSGTPLSSAKVSYVLNGSTKSASTNSSGNYTISSLPGGERNFTYLLSGYVTRIQTVNIVTNSNINNDLQLSKLGSITGTVKNTSTGVVLSSVTVAYQMNGVNKTVKTNNKGVYTISGLPAGTFNLTFSYSGYNSQIATVNVDYDQSVTQNISLTHI